MKYKYYTKLVDMIKNTLDNSYIELSNLENLDFNNRNDIANVSCYTDQVRIYQSYNTNLNNLKNWLDKYYQQKDCLEKYAPNMLNAGCKAYFKDNPFSLILNKELFTEGHSDLDFDTHFMTQNISSILEETVLEDEQLKNYLSSIAHEFWTNDTPNNIHSTTPYWNESVKIFQNSFFKNTLGFNLVEHINNTVKDKVFLNMIYKTQKAKKEINDKQLGYTYSVSEDIILFVEENNLQIPLQSLIEGTKKLNDEDKAKTVILLSLYPANKEKPLERILQCLDFMAQTNIKIDQTPSLKSAILNILSNNLMKELEFIQILEAKTSKYTIDNIMNKNTQNNSSTDDVAEFKI